MSDPAIGREIGSYQIVAILGQGGMGKVYKAQHPYIGKQVAVKFLKSELSAKPDSVQRFFQEARAVNDIHHENVIDVLDFGRTQDGEYFIIMELLLGKTLGDVIKAEAPFPPKRLVHVGLQLCSALAAAHEKSIIHRDLKPDNIFLVTRAGQKDFAKVLDFGLAKLVDDSAGTHTTTGMVMGTPLYMAPEQALGKTLDAQTDVYALGVILYQLATGTVPFFDPNPVALATMHVTAKVPRPSERHSSLDPKLEKIILRCLEKEKEARYSNMTAVALELAAVLGTDTTQYFGRDITKESSNSEGDELPTTSDGDRTVITAAPTKTPAPLSGQISEQHLVPTKVSIEATSAVGETSNLRAEITGKNSSAGSKGNRGLLIGMAFLLLLGVAGYLLFTGPGKNTAAPSKPNNPSIPLKVGPVPNNPTSVPNTPSSQSQATQPENTDPKAVQDPKNKKNTTKPNNGKNPTNPNQTKTNDTTPSNTNPPANGGDGTVPNKTNNSTNPKNPPQVKNSPLDFNGSAPSQNDPKPAVKDNPKNK